MNRESVALRAMRCAATRILGIYESVGQSPSQRANDGGGWPILFESRLLKRLPPFPRSWREGGPWPRARHLFVLASARSIAIRSRQSLPSPLRSEQSYSISSPLASRPALALPDCDGCSGAFQCASLRSIPENRNNGPAKNAEDVSDAAFVT